MPALFMFLAVFKNASVSRLFSPFSVIGFRPDRQVAPSPAPCPPPARGGGQGAGEGATCRSGRNPMTEKGENSRLTEAFLKTAKNMNKAGILDEAAYEEITMRHSNV